MKRTLLSAAPGHRWLGCLAVLLLVSGGCSSEDGPPRYRVSGTVTYQGKPVPVGTIQFLPDTSQGNSGPPAFAEIKDGAFDTGKTGKGSIGGPHLVTIDAFSGQNVDPDMKPSGDLLVSGFQKRFDLQAEADTVLEVELTQK